MIPLSKYSQNKANEPFSPCVLRGRRLYQNSAQFHIDAHCLGIKLP